jgi:hypothetical protein
MIYKENLIVGIWNTIVAWFVKGNGKEENSIDGKKNMWWFELDIWSWEEISKTFDKWKSFKCMCGCHGKLNQ